MQESVFDDDIKLSEMEPTVDENQGRTEQGGGGCWGCVTCSGCVTCKMVGKLK